MQGGNGALTPLLATHERHAVASPGHSPPWRLTKPLSPRTLKALAPVSTKAAERQDKCGGASAGCGSRGRLPGSASASFRLQDRGPATPKQAGARGAFGQWRRTFCHPGPASATTRCPQCPQAETPPQPPACWASWSFPLSSAPEPLGADKHHPCLAMVP